jgi:hypothetical protein
VALMALIWGPVGVWYLRRERAFDTVLQRFSRSPR